MAETHDNDNSDSKLVGVSLVVILFFVLLFAIISYRSAVATFFASTPFLISHLRINYNTISFALFSASIAYPVVAQFIRYQLDDLDEISIIIENNIKKETQNTSKMKEQCEKIASHIGKVKLKLRKFHTFDEFQPYIISAFILLILATLNNWINNEIDKTKSGFLVVTNLFVLEYASFLGFFLFLKVKSIQKFLGRQRRSIISIHDELTKSPIERILENIEN